MKLVIAVVPDRSAGGAIRKLTQAQFSCTRLASTGGFLHQGNTTLVIGVPQARVKQVLDLLRSASPGEGVAFVLPVRNGEHGVIRAFP